MSKITREEVLEASRILYEYAKMSKPICGKKSIEYCNKLINDYFNQQPQLSEDVEELLRTVYEEDYYNTNSTPEYISNKLKQHIQAQENKLNAIRSILDDELPFTDLPKDYSDGEVEE